MEHESVWLQRQRLTAARLNTARGDLQIHLNWSSITMIAILHEFNLVCFAICISFGMMVGIFGFDTMHAVVRKAFGKGDDDDNDGGGGTLLPIRQGIN
jgi:hypothetical protein